MLAAELCQPVLRNLDFCTHGLPPDSYRKLLVGRGSLPALHHIRQFEKTLVAPASSRCSTGRRPVPLVFSLLVPKVILGNAFLLPSSGLASFASPVGCVLRTNMSCSRNLMVRRTHPTVPIISPTSPQSPPA